MIQFSKKMHLSISLEKAWDFFSNPENLKIITPPFLNFVIQTGYEEKIFYPGMIIIYEVRPIFNFPLTWVTEITHIKEKEYFIDEQRLGPYCFWHHQHFFKETKNGVEVMDLVSYQLKFRLLAPFLNRFFVKSKLEEIFSYRQLKLKELFDPSN